jgi:hypothetical protein
MFVRQCPLVAFEKDRKVIKRIVHAALLVKR